MSVAHPAYMRTREAAACLRLSPSTLKKLRSSGGGPNFMKLPTGSVVYLVHDLGDGAISRRIRSTREIAGA
jgi:hypothetical protein